MGQPIKRNYDEYVGRQFGQYTVLSIASVDKFRSPTNGKMQTSVRLICKCSCGEERNVRLRDLTQGKSARCQKCREQESIRRIHAANQGKTFRGSQNHNWKGYRGILPKRYITSVRSNALVRGLEYEISEEYLADLYEKQGRRCALSGVPLVFVGAGEEYTMTRSAISIKPSLDRIDSSKGYVEGNVQWVSATINLMKQAFTQECFVDACCRVAQQIKKDCPHCNGQEKRNTDAE